jgi:putative GTP pyrophosphokinase
MLAEVDSYEICRVSISGNKANFERKVPIGMKYTDAQKQEIKVAYENLQPRLLEAEERLLAVVQHAIARIGDRRLVRAQIRGNRIKSLDSVRRKAEEQGLQPRDVCLSICDLVGARVVCNTAEDVYRFKELLHEELSLAGPIEEQDYMAKPKESGYRGLHLNFRIGVGRSFNQMRVPCEVQIRTLLQDSWAELVHSDIYKEGADLPQDLRGRTQDLATVMAAADQIASKVRARVMQETKVEPESVHLDTLSNEGLAFIFAEVFGRWPPGYAVQRALSVCQDVGITAVANLREKLSSQSFRDVIGQAYTEELGLNFSLSPEDILALTPIAAVKGDDEAVKESRKLAKTEREEAEEFWRGEVLGSLPESFEAFIERLKERSIDVEEVAEALGVLRKCSVCDAKIVSDDSFLEAIASHYGADANYDLLGVLQDATECWASDDDPDLCSYHAYKDNNN